MLKFPRKNLFLLVVILLAAMPAFSNGRSHETLLSLYRQSDAIFVGRYDKKEDFGTNRVGDGYTTVTTRTYFDVSSVLKGESRKFFVLVDEEFRYQIAPRAAGEAPRDAVFIPDIDTYDPAMQPHPGDTVLVFLKREGDSFILVDDRDGVRKITPSEESIFTERLNELNSIFVDRKADASKLSDWLIRCAEQPATRWDGTHELLHNVKELNGDQRSSLTNIVLGSSFQTGDLSTADRELIALVKQWDADFVARYMTEQLRSRAFSSRQNTTIMLTVAQMLGDSQAETLAGRYAELSASRDDEASRSVDASRSSTLTGFISLADRLLGNRPAE
jgi:hypothetical protein